MTENNGTNNGWHDAAGRFAKNNPGKRPGSSKNKLRDKIRTFINENWEHLPAWFEKLKPKEKIEVLLSLMPYAVSRLQSISLSETEVQPSGEIDFSRLSDDDLRTLSAIQEKLNGNGIEN